LTPPATASAAPSGAGRGFERVVRAAQSVGGFVNSKLKYATATDLGILGIVAKQPVVAHEELMRIPKACFLTEDYVLLAAPALYEAVASVPGLAGCRPGLVTETRTAAFLALLLGEALERLEDAGEVEADGSIAALWRCHCDLLLDQDFTGHPYWCAIHDDDELRRVLLPSREYDHAGARSKEVLQTCRVLAQSLPADQLGSRFGPGLYMQARVCILSRAFDCDEAGVGLIPIVDLFNHSDSHGAIIELTADAMVVRAIRDYASGEHITITYGQKSNPLLFRTYGFTNPPVSEPSWSFVLQGQKPQHIYAEYLPEKLRELSIHLDTHSVSPSLLEAITAAQDGGHSAVEFLRRLCEYACEAYQSDPFLQPALEALRLARFDDPRSGAWWEKTEPEALQRLCASQALAESAMRVKMSEYLALVSFKEIADFCAGQLIEDRCLSEAAAVRHALCKLLWA